MDKSTREVRLATWAGVIRECRQSGMTVRNWCSQNNVNEKQFYYWQRCVRKELYEAATSENALSVESNRFVELPVPHENTVLRTDFQTVAIAHIGNASIELSNSASPELIHALLMESRHAE